jgi:hypothetical protein
LEAQQGRAGRVEIVVRHEALHTLGLGENPARQPGDQRRVAQRCAPSAAGDRRRERRGS